MPTIRIVGLNVSSIFSWKSRVVELIICGGLFPFEMLHTDCYFPVKAPKFFFCPVCSPRCCWGTAQCPGVLPHSSSLFFSSLFCPPQFCEVILDHWNPGTFHHHLANILCNSSTYKRIFQCICGSMWASHPTTPPSSLNLLGGMGFDLQFYLGSFSRVVSVSSTSYGLDHLAASRCLDTSPLQNLRRTWSPGWKGYKTSSVG